MDSTSGTVMSGVSSDTDAERVDLIERLGICVQWIRAVALLGDIDTLMQSKTLAVQLMPTVNVVLALSEVEPTEDCREAVNKLWDVTEELLREVADKFRLKANLH